jgi:dihydroxyacid dehydratase/phosphogluconate dehydratase
MTHSTWKAALRKSAGYCSGDVDHSDEEIARRVEAYEPPEPLYRRGVMAKYAASVSSSSKAAVTS